MTPRNSPNAKRPRGAKSPSGEPSRLCGLCGKTSRLTKTECCGQWICDDEGSYAMFSFARNSCSRNHRRLTLCGYHHAEGHSGDWRECGNCRESFETEMYVYYGTNEYNFVKLENPPAYEPTLCASCRTPLRLGDGGYVVSGGNHYCIGCMGAARPSAAR